MLQRLNQYAGLTALALSIFAVILSASGLASASHTVAGTPENASASHVLASAPRNAGVPRDASAPHAASASRNASHTKTHARAEGRKPALTGSRLGPYRVSTKPYARGVLLLGGNRKFPAAAIPTVKDADELDGMSVEVLYSCPPDTVDLGTWCLMSAPYPLTNSQIGENNYFWASQACVKEGGYLPTAAQLIGAANRVKIEGAIHESPLTATVEQDQAVGLKDQREMTATLVTTQAGSEAAGSEGVSQGATGNPQTGEPNPVPQPAVPAPETLQYVTIYSNGQKGGFAGSEPVSQPENFRCAFNKSPGAINQQES